MLTRLPPEVLAMVVEKLTKANLKALSRTSSYLHAVVARYLWRSVTIEPWSEYGLHRMDAAAVPQKGLQLATQLHFRSGIQYVTARRCPHTYDHDNPWDTDDEDDIETEHADDGDMTWPRFNRLAQTAELLIRQFENGQLQNFSWDLGTCVPSTILGTNGIVSLKHSLIRSLSLATDSTCHQFYDSECEIDLSSFRQLQSLSWKAPTADNLSALGVAIHSNSAHLQSLQVDFVNWPKLRDALGYYSDEEDDDGIQARNYFVGGVLCWTKRSPRPMLPALSVLSLSQVPLMPAMAHVISFDNLCSLTLRMCPAWDLFLDKVMQLNTPIKLRTLEILESDSVSHGLGDLTITEFLGAFEGLEELFISQAGPVTALESWTYVARHYATLKRFVHHQRVLNVNEESPLFEMEEHDLVDLAIIGRDMRRIREDPSQNPLAMLDLEYIGLACVPQRLKYLLLPFVSKNTLKVLHIRQSSSDLEYYASWAIQPEPGMRSKSPSGSEQSISWTDSGTTSPVSEVEDVSLGSNIKGIRMEDGLRDEFRRFAEWIFGPQGIASLDIIIFGDFAHGGRTTHNNLLFCRNPGESGCFRLLGVGEPEWADIQQKYRNAIEACPVEPLWRVNLAQ